MLLVLSALPVWSQTVGAKRYWVYFTGKTNSGYSLDRPQEFLSEKAIARRERQGIPITEDDLPVSQSQVDALIQAGAKVIHRSRWFNAVSVEVQNPVVLQKMSSFSFVQATSAVHTYKCENDERLGDLSEVSSLKTHEAAASQAVYDYGLAYHQTYMLGGDYMHAKGFHGEGMLIAVIDAGFWEVGTPRGERNPKTGLYPPRWWRSGSAFTRWGAKRQAMRAIKRAEATDNWETFTVGGAS